MHNYFVFDDVTLKSLFAYNLNWRHGAYVAVNAPR